MSSLLIRKGNTLSKETLSNFLFILPAIIIFAVFYIFPFYDIIKLSLYEWNGIDLHRHFVGLDNFMELMQDHHWWGALAHAGFITLIALTFQNLLAFSLALACDRELRMKNFYKAVFFIPPVLSEVVVGLVWTWILYSGTQAGEQIGLLNYFLDKVGLHHLINNWLSNPKTALPCIAIVHSWKGFGWGFIVFLAGLQMIDEELYEAAKVDGAGRWEIMINIILPMMLPVICVVAILTILGSMQAFILIISMMGRGLTDYTSVPVTQIIEAMTRSKRFGYACAQGVSFGAILVFASFSLKMITDKLKRI